MRYILVSIIALTCACASKPTAKKFELRNISTNYLPNHLELRSRISSVSKPLISEDKIFIANAYDGVKAINRSNQSVAWSNLHEGGVESGLALRGSRLYYGANDHYFYAVHRESGKEIWRVKVEGEVLSEPVIMGNRIYFLTGSNHLYALNMEDGKQIWRYKRNIKQDLSVRGASTPIIHNQRIYIGFSDGYFASLRLNDGSLVWERLINSNPKFKDVDARAVIHKDRIFISGFDSKLYALTLSNGGILWSLEEGGVYAPTLFDDKLIYANTEGDLLLLDASSGKLLQRKSAKDGVYREPLLKDNLIIVGSSHGPIEIIDAITWKTLGQYHTGLGVASKAVISEKNRFLFVSEGSSLVEMQYQWRRLY